MKNGMKAVDNLSFEIKPGEICALLGPNGAGKTTTIKIILGILKPDSGVVRAYNKQIDKNYIDYKKCFGYVSDNHDIYDCLTGKEYLDFIADAYEVDEEVRNEKYNYLLDAFKLKPFVNNPIKSYSHGMKQKIVIIGSLINDPSVWILDEPMTGLDVESTHLLKQLIIKQAESGKIVLFSSHILEVCEKLCTKVIIINKGQNVLEKEMKDIGELKNSSLEDFFLEIVKDE
jgi:ABC-2 type transport system ATP-binding protein